MLIHSISAAARSALDGKVCPAARAVRNRRLSARARTGQIVTVAAALLLQNFAADIAITQQRSRTPRVGILSPHSSSTSSFHDDVKHRLLDLGYVEGKSLEFELRFADGQSDRIPALAEELVRGHVDVIVTTTTPAVRAAIQATTTIPIVIGGVDDAVEQGFVSSLARPSGNVTGTSWLNSETGAKRLDVLQQAIPGASRMGILREAVAGGPSARTIMAAGQALGVQIYLLELRAANELEDAFADMIRNKVDALNVLPGPMISAETKKIVELALRHRLPAIFPDRDFVVAGALMSYGPSLSIMYREAANYVHRILTGAKPADLPVQQPTRFELIINLTTANALGLNLPPTLLARADEVIE